MKGLVLFLSLVLTVECFHVSPPPSRSGLVRASSSAQRRQLSVTMKEVKDEKPADVLLRKVEGDEGDLKTRRPRAAARAEKRAKESGISGELRYKLLEEQSNPFRKFRQTIYLACAGSASIGAFIAASRVVASLTGDLSICIHPTCICF